MGPVRREFVSIGWIMREATEVTCLVMLGRNLNGDGPRDALDFRHTVR